MLNTFSQSAQLSLITALPLKEWGFDFGNRLFISGPCSVESEAQILETAQQLSDQPVDILRGGIWKPRTRPNTFEGMGTIGLKWLKNAGNAIGKPVCVEVANALHVEKALEADIDILWVGARTTVNPFAVQEIADALKGIDIPVMVKNPINPDLELWIGGLERICLAGITRVAALHRGFSNYGTSKYRNKPFWEIPIELRRRYPDLPIICDPSHIAGNRELIPKIAQNAFDLDFDGIMIEAHRNPEVAFSDAQQQVTPERYGEIVKEIVMRNDKIEDPQSLHQLETYRETIDSLDKKLISVLGKRMKVAQQIGELKKQNNLTIFQEKRWGKIRETRISLGTEKGLTENFMQVLLEAIHKESIEQQSKIMNE